MNESQPKAFRADIQGLRAIAVATVFLYHLWPESMTGGYVGVDVFFVVSGFLITNILKREMLASGRLSLPNFYIRRARRLLPAAAVVIIASGILTLSLFPVTRWNNLAGEMSASALYVQNIYLYFQSVDYLRQDLPPSLLRHYWSLSVEEQFYFIWPILMVLFAGVARRNRRAGEWALFAACSAVFVLSALSSAFMTADNPSGGYFLPQNRLFELALGGMLSLAFPYVTLRSWFARLLGWSGLGGILAAAFLFNHETVFPGTAALLPTLATALILLAGKNQEHTDWRSVGGILGLKPLTYLGDISYSLYLWHWPLVLSAFEIWGEDLNLTQGLMVIALSVALSHLTKYHVEDRWRYAHPESRGWLALTKFSVPSIACVLLFAGAVQFSIRSPIELPPDFDEHHPGAVSFALGSADEPPGDMAFVPPLESALRDNPRLYMDKCHVAQPDIEPQPCWYGPSDAARVIVLTGDSHAAHWQPMLRKIAEQQGWAVVTHTKSSCPLIQVRTVRGNDNYEECFLWVQHALQQIIALKPDLVVTGKISSTRVTGITDPRKNEQRVIDAMSETWNILNRAGISVLAIEQTPRFDYRVPDCMAESPESMMACGKAREEALSRFDPTPMAASKADDAQSLNVNDWICTDTDCPPIIGNVLVYRDEHHLTATYARTLTIAFEHLLVQKVQKNPVIARQDPTASMFRVFDNE